MYHIKEIVKIDMKTWLHKKFLTLGWGWFLSKTLKNRLLERLHTLSEYQFPWLNFVIRLLCLPLHRCSLNKKKATKSAECEQTGKCAHAFLLHQRVWRLQCQLHLSCCFPFQREELFDLFRSVGQTRGNNGIACSSEWFH